MVDNPPDMTPRQNSPQIHVMPSMGISFTPANSTFPLTGLKHEPQTIEWLWRLFNKLPKTRPQLRNSQNATARLLHWRSKSILPPRSSYTSTVDYYEAYLPLYCARKHFNAFAEPSGMLSVMQALQTILPKSLF